MRINAFIPTVLLCAAVISGVIAPPASAEVPTMMDGDYAYQDEDGVVATWTIRTTCTPACVAHVTTAPGYGFTAPLVNGRYAVKRTVPEGAVCPPYQLGDNGSSFDGGTHPVHVYQWWDPVTLAGEVDFLETTAPCGLHDLRDTFTLTKIG